jgi:mannose-6-phosphate isomerase-like protein (cupin superfamily)
MGGNFWTRQELIEKARTGEIQQPKYAQKWSVLKQSDHCTLFAADIGAPKGYPLHVHHHHDEVMIVLDGEGEAAVGTEKRKVKQGDVIFVPRGTAHTLRFAGQLLAIDCPTFDTGNPDRAIVE